MTNCKHPKLTWHNWFQPQNEHSGLFIYEHPWDVLGKPERTSWPIQYCIWSKTMISWTCATGFKTSHSGLIRSLFSWKPQNEMVQACLSVGSCWREPGRAPSSWSGLHRSCGLCELRDSSQQAQGRSEAPEKGQVWRKRSSKEILAWPEGQRTAVMCKAGNW